MSFCKYKVNKHHQRLTQKHLLVTFSTRLSNPLTLKPINATVPRTLKILRANSIPITKKRNSSQAATHRRSSVNVHAAARGVDAPVTTSKFTPSPSVPLRFAAACLQREIQMRRLYISTYISTTVRTLLTSVARTRVAPPRSISRVIIFLISISPL